MGQEGNRYYYLYRQLVCGRNPLCTFEDSLREAANLGELLANHVEIDGSKLASTSYDRTLYACHSSLKPRTSTILIPLSTVLVSLFEIMPSRVVVACQEKS